MRNRNPVLPSHMKKAIERLETLAGVVNLVIEAVDARAPNATRCDFIARIIGGCRAATVLTKTDIADPDVTKLWLKHIRSRGNPAISFPTKSPSDRNRFIHELLKSDSGEADATGTRAVVVGLPNVGKSTITNFLIGRRGARVGAKPGVTRGIQLVNIRDDFLLLDTPGIVSPRIARREQGITLALVGCLQENFYDPEDAAFHLLSTALAGYAGKFKTYYDLKDTIDDPADFCNAVARRRGFLLKGGAEDIERAYRVIVNDFSSGRITGVSLEAPVPS